MARPATRLARASCITFYSDPITRARSHERPACNQTRQPGYLVQHTRSTAMSTEILGVVLTGVGIILAQILALWRMHVAQLQRMDGMQRDMIQRMDGMQRDMIQRMDGCSET